MAAKRKLVNVDEGARKARATRKRAASVKRAAAKLRKEAAKRHAKITAVPGLEPPAKDAQRYGIHVDNLIAVMSAAMKFGGEGQEFTTTQIARETGLVYSSAYKWLKGLERHRIVFGHLTKKRTKRGDYRWRLLRTLAPVYGGGDEETERYDKARKLN